MFDPNLLHRVNISAVNWKEYSINPADSHIAYNLELSQETDRKRCIDPVCANTLLGGLMIHTVRRQNVDVQFVSGGSNVLNAATRNACSQDRFAGLIAACLEIQGIGESVMPPELSPFGQDPVMNSQSSIHNTGVQASDYYNASNSLEVNQGTSIPFGFHHYPLPGESCPNFPLQPAPTHGYPFAGYPDGYPIVISSYLTNDRARMAMSYIEEGGLFDAAMTKYTMLEAVTYNPSAVAFGLFKGMLEWLDSGQIKLVYQVRKVWINPLSHPQALTISIPPHHHLTFSPFPPLRYLLFQPSSTMPIRGVGTPR